MTAQDNRRAYLREKFRRFILNEAGGAFTPKTRKRLVGISNLSGRGRTKNKFWYDLRNDVRRALVDLMLFIEFADEDQVSQVISEETLRPIVIALSESSPMMRGLSRTRVEIAGMFVRAGFRYLETMQSHITLSHRRTIEEALDLTDHLEETLKNKAYVMREKLSE